MTREKFCKCGTEMEDQDSWGGGKWWCPNCGRFCHTYACEDDVWKEPKSLKGYTFGNNDDPTPEQMKEVFKRAIKEVKRRAKEADKKEGEV